MCYQVEVFQEQWDTPYLDSPNELPDQRRKHLVRQWLNLATIGREFSFDYHLFLGV